MRCMYKNLINRILPVIVSIIVAIITIFLYDEFIFVGIGTILNMLLNGSVILLIFMVILSIFLKYKIKCICYYGPFIIIGAVGTIIFSSLLLTISVAVNIFSVLLGIVALFATLSIIEFILFLLCSIKSKCNC